MRPTLLAELLDDPEQGRRAPGGVAGTLASSARTASLTSGHCGLLTRKPPDNADVPGAPGGSRSVKER